MECRDAQRLIRAGASEEALDEHLAGCPACAELAGEGARLARALDAPHAAAPLAGAEELLAVMAREDVSTRGKLRAMPTPRRVALSAATAFFGALVYFAVWRRPDWAVYPALRMAGILGLLSAGIGLASALGLPRIYRPRRRLGWLLLATLAVIPFGLAVLPSAELLHPANHSEEFWGPAFACLTIGTLAAVPAFAGSWFVMRADQLDFGTAGFVAVGAAMSANFALQVHCPVVDPSHLLAGHSSLVLAYVVIAWLLARLSRPAARSEENV